MKVLSFLFQWFLFIFCIGIAVIMGISALFCLIETDVLLSIGSLALCAIGVAGAITIWTMGSIYDSLC